MPETPCLICKSVATKKVTVIGDDYRVRRCDNCQFSWVDRRDLARPESKPDYEDYGYSRNILASFEQMQAGYVSGFKERVRRNLPDRDLSQCSFLDIGCANGEYLWTARQVGFGLVSGVEIDHAAAARAAEHGEIADHTGKLSNRSFDVIQIKNVLGNIEDPMSFLSDCLTVLSPAGTLFLDVLNQDSLTSSINKVAKYDGRRYGPLRPPYVINGFNPSSIAHVLNAFGLRQLWGTTSYVGSRLVPYGHCPAARVLGFVGSLAGRGSMLITESVWARKPSKERKNR